MNKPVRKTNRLAGYNYSQYGFYFMTIATLDREPFFGDVRDGVMHQSPIGKLADRCWREIPAHFNDVGLDEYIIMPDHVHGILFISGDDGVGSGGGSRCAELLFRVANQYKSSVRRICEQRYGGARFGWQERYYDRVIRDEQELLTVREYIRANPQRWDKNPRPDHHIHPWWKPSPPRL